MQATILLISLSKIFFAHPLVLFLSKRHLHVKLGGKVGIRWSYAFIYFKLKKKKEYERVCLCLFICLPFSLSVRLSVCLADFLSFSLSFPLSACQLACLSVCSSDCLPFCLCVSVYSLYSAAHRVLSGTTAPSCTSLDLIQIVFVDKRASLTGCRSCTTSKETLYHVII
jgi:hypothetical protein